MTRNPDPALLEALGNLLLHRHVGSASAATWDQLRSELRGEGVEVNAVRRLQEAASALRRHPSSPIPVIGTSGGGVCVAETVDELDDAIGERRRRALSSLAELSGLKRIKASMLGQGSLGVRP